MRAKKRALAAGGFGGLALLANVPFLLDGGIDWLDSMIVVVSLGAVGVLTVPVLMRAGDRIRRRLAIAATIVMWVMCMGGGAFVVTVPLMFVQIPSFWVWTAIGVLAGGIAAGFGFATLRGLMPAPTPVMKPPARRSIA